MYEAGSPKVISTAISSIFKNSIRFIGKLLVPVNLLRALESY